MRIRLTEAILSLLILLLVYTPPLLSQEGRGSFADTTVAFVRAVEAINGLHKGALIVTIPTESKKIKELDRLLASEKLKEKWMVLQDKYRLEDAQTEPMVSLIANDNWVEFTLRYVVEYRKRRVTKTKLFTKILQSIEAEGR